MAEPLQVIVPDGEGGGAVPQTWLDLLLGGVSSWHWWILAIVFLLLEVVAPGIAFLWLSVSAAVVGLLLLVADPGWEAQLAIFAVLSIGSAVAGRRYLQRHQDPPDQQVNVGAKSLVGRTAILSEPITHGSGWARCAGSLWRVSGPPLPSGVAVRVVDVDGTRLIVEPAPAESAPPSVESPSSP